MEEKLKRFITSCFESFGFEGIKKSIVINNKHIYLYYSNFSGEWGYSNEEYTKRFQLDVIPEKHWFKTEIEAFNFLVKTIEK